MINARITLDFTPDTFLWMCDKKIKIKFFHLGEICVIIASRLTLIFSLLRVFLYILASVGMVR